MGAENDKRFHKKSLYIILSFSLFELLIHLYTNAFAGYGYFRDELYYIACSRHLAAGYVDQPPLASFLLFISIKLFGNSIFAIRLLPAFVSSITVFITGLIVRKLNGGYFAIVLACISILLAPLFLGMNSIYSMNCFDWLFWSLAAFMVIKIIIEGKNSLWIWLGIVLGFGLLNKIDLLWFGAGLLIGLIFTKERKFLNSRWIYLAGIIAFIMFSPYIIWNFTHQFATLEFMRRAAEIKYSSQNPGTLISDLFLIMNPFTIPVWFAGIYFFFFDKDGKTYRAIGYIFLVTLLILIINWHSKAEYLGPAFPMLFAAGGVELEKFIKMKSIKCLKYSLPAIIFLSGIILMPLALPILPVESFLNYSKSLGIRPSNSESNQLEKLPQHYADMFGWKNMAASVSKVYTSLSPEEQKTTIVFAQNYGEAGAIDFFRKDFSLPRVICGHNNYWFWGPGDTTFTTVIVIGGNKEDHLRSCTSVENAGIIQSEYAMPYENNLPIFICRQFKIPMKLIWERVRFFI